MPQTAGRRVRTATWRPSSPAARSPAAKQPGGKQAGGAGGHPYAKQVLEPEELVDLLAKLGFQTAQLAHALVGMVEAHATRAEEAYRAAGAELTEASLMAFAGANCRSEVDELALLSWRAQRLTGALMRLDFGGPAPRFPRSGEVSSGDVLMRTIRLVAGALTAMTKAAHTAVNPLGERGDAAVAGVMLGQGDDHARAGHRGCAHPPRGR